MKVWPAVFAIILTILWIPSVLAQCDKLVNDNGVIQKTLEGYFGTQQVAGEPDAVVDWCYYGGWNQLFLFLMNPCRSETEAKALMDDIGLGILKECRSRQKRGETLSILEEIVLEKGFTVQMMQRGYPGGSGLLTTYINPSRVP